MDGQNQTGYALKANDFHNRLAGDHRGDDWMEGEKEQDADRPITSTDQQFSGNGGGIAERSILGDQ